MIYLTTEDLVLIVPNPPWLNSHTDNIRVGSKLIVCGKISGRKIYFINKSVYLINKESKCLEINKLIINFASGKQKETNRNRLSTWSFFEFKIEFKTHKYPVKMNTNNSNPQESRDSRKATVISATAGIAGGAALGVGAAAVYSATANAAETDESPLIEKAEAPIETPAAAPETHVEVHHHHHTTTPPQPQAEVVEYNMVIDENGNHIADMAQVNYRGDNIMYLDSDLNGEADSAWYDINRNQIIDEGEVVDVRDSHIAMNALKANAQNIAYVTTEPDVNYGEDSAHIGQEGVVENTGNDISGIDYSQPTSDSADLSINTIDTDMPDYVNDADIDAFVS